VAQEENGSAADAASSSLVATRIRRWQLQRRRDVYCSYLRVKVDEGDWSGVADAAMALKVLEAELRGLSETLPQ